MITSTIILECAKNAAMDSLHILPFLFVIFLVIEFLEYFYFDKITCFSNRSVSFAPLFGGILASFPQCGFSVIASTLYIRGLISKGTLIAVYISTSDEAIPVLLTEPAKFKVVLPLILAKILIGVTAGYLIDFFFKHKATLPSTDAEIPEKGCCQHNLDKPDKKDLILHPLLHTINVIIFVFFVSMLLNIFLGLTGSHAQLGAYLLKNSMLQPIFSAIVGLIPNCAVSVGIVVMYIKGALSFGSVIAGLSSSAGLGILVLIKKNKNRKDTILIILMLLFISILAGIFFTIFDFGL